MWQIQFSEHCSVVLFGWKRGHWKSWGNADLQLRPGLEERFERKHDWDATSMPEQLVSVCGVCRVCVLWGSFCFQVILHVQPAYLQKEERGFQCSVLLLLHVGKA